MTTMVTELDASRAAEASTPPRIAGRARVAAIFDGILETGWLAALVILPLLFSPNLTTVFGVPKSSALWTLAAVMATVFLMKAAAVGVSHTTGDDSASAASPAWHLPWSSTPAPHGATIIAAGLTLGTVAALATLNSVAPEVSWWGHYGSFTGLCTALSLIIIFAIVATHLRTRRQLEWLLLAAVWASVPFLRFGAAQKWNFSPLPWSTDITPSMVFSPAGDTLATGVYLAIIVPLTIYLAVAARAVEFRLIYVLLAVAQLGVLAISGFAGAWIGTACGLFALALLLGWGVASARSRRLGTLAALVVALVTIVGLLFFARAQDTSWHPSGWLKSAVDGARSRSTALDYRRQVWQGTWNLGLQRPILGWGPDTFVSTFGRTAPLSLQSAPDRGGQRPAQSFSLPLEIFQGTGVLGLLAWLGTLIAFFGTCVALLRRRAVSRQGHLAVAALIAGMIAYLVTTLLTLPSLPALLLFWILLAVAAALAGPLWERVVAVDDSPVAVTDAGNPDGATDPLITAPAVLAEQPRNPGSVDESAFPIPTDPWRGVGALLALGALVLFFVPAAPLGIVWQGIQQVRADAWNHDGQAAETVSDPGKTARSYSAAWAAAPFQPLYGLNAGRGILQNLGSTSPTPTKAQQLAVLQESERDLTAAHVLNPWDVGVAEQLARLWGSWGSVTGQNRFGEAQRLIDATETQHPNDVTLITDWAQAAQQLGRPDVTVQQYARLSSLAPHDAAIQLGAVSTLSALIDTMMQAQPPQVAVAESAAEKGLQAAQRAVDASHSDPGAAWLQVAALSYKNAQLVVTAHGNTDRRSVAAVRQMLNDHEKAVTYAPRDSATILNGIKAAFFLRDSKAAYKLAKLGLRYHPGDPTFTQVIKSLPKSASTP